MGLVGLMVLLFSGFFIAFVTSRHDAFLTAAEDMGNMDQAVWSIILARYANADESFIFWSKGDTAFIEEGPSQTQTYKGCVGEKKAAR